jgi:hypothetical protein
MNHARWFGNALATVETIGAWNFPRAPLPVQSAIANPQSAIP